MQRLSAIPIALMLSAAVTAPLAGELPLTSPGGEAGFVESDARGTVQYGYCWVYIGGKWIRFPC